MFGADQQVPHAGGSYKEAEDAAWSIRTDPFDAAILCAPPHEVIVLPVGMEWSDEHAWFVWPDED